MVKNIFEGLISQLSAKVLIYTFFSRKYFQRLSSDIEKLNQKLALTQNMLKFRSHQSFLVTYQQSVLAKLERLEAFIRLQLGVVDGEIKKIMRLLHTGAELDFKL